MTLNARIVFLVLIVLLSGIPCAFAQFETKPADNKTIQNPDYNPEQDSDLIGEMPAIDPETDVEDPTLVNPETVKALSAPSEVKTTEILIGGIGAPVIIDGDTLFTLYQVGILSAEERAKITRDRILRAADSDVRHEPVRVVYDIMNSGLYLGPFGIVTITEKDAQIIGSPRNVLAKEWAEKIELAVRKRAESTSPQRMAINFALAMLVTGVFGGVFYYLRRITSRAYRQFDAWHENDASTSLRGGKHWYSHFKDHLLGGLRMLRYGLYVGLTYGYVVAILSLFPATKDLSGTLFNFVAVPVKTFGRAVFNSTPNLMFVVVTMAGAWVLTRILRGFFMEIDRGTIAMPGFHRDWAKPTFQISRLLIIAVTVSLIYPYIPAAQSPAFLVIVLVLGGLFSLGAMSTVSNAVAGIVLAYMLPFRVGDRVKIADTMGDVVEKSLLHTRLRTLKNVDVTIPNTKVVSGVIVNYSTSAQKHGLILTTTLYVDYRISWRVIHDLLMGSARDTRYVLKDPEPFVLQTGLENGQVGYELNVYTNEPFLMSVIYSELHQNIQDRFNTASIEVVVPAAKPAKDSMSLRSQPEIISKELNFSFSAEKTPTLVVTPKATWFRRQGTSGIKGGGS